LPDTTGWDAALDELENRLAACLSGRIEELAGWTPPSGLPAVPPELRERAASLTAAQRDALAHLESERIRVLTELSAVRSPARPAVRNMGVYFDATG
jgi:hypothetical protein